MFNWLAGVSNFRSFFDYDRIEWADILAGEEGVCVFRDFIFEKYLRYPPSFLVDPDNCNIFGPTILFPRPIDSPAYFCASIREAVVQGFRTVTDRLGRITIDECYRSSDEERNFFENKKREYAEDTFLKWSPEKAGFTCTNPHAHVVKLSGTTVFFSTPEPSNYGSFIFRVLPKILILQKLSPNLRVLVYCRENTYRELLVLAGLKHDQILHHDPRCVYECEHLLMISNRNPYTFLDNESRILFTLLRDQTLNEESSIPISTLTGNTKKVYVSRYTPEKMQKRQMLNEAGLIEKLKERNFFIMSPQEHDAKTQIRIFAAADLIVGPSGAGMFNSVFCREGTTIIDIESEPHWIYAHCNLFASSALQYSVFVGSAEDTNWQNHHKPWRLNIAKLLEFLDNHAILV